VAVYAIGDVQGCADELQELLARLRFDATRDRLWFVGDLVNRGPDSLATLRLVKSLGDAAIVVLGNHDLHLLAVARGGAGWRRQDAGLRPVVEAPDAESLLDWLQSRPLLHHDAQLGITLFHAGLPPQWDIATARSCAREVERRLRGENAGALFEHMYGNEPSLWHDGLDGRMHLAFKGPPAMAPAESRPWFRIPWRRSAGERMIFGHWSALGYVEEAGVLGLDTGCVWGGTLTGQRIDAGPSAPLQVPSHSGGLPLED
jgi:bis(5'-nucleosyl)-tetraphosphatase (symmetrical)